MHYLFQRATQADEGRSCMSVAYLLVLNCCVFAKNAGIVDQIVNAMKMPRLDFFCYALLATWALPSFLRTAVHLTDTH